VRKHAGAGRKRSGARITWLPFVSRRAYAIRVVTDLAEIRRLGTQKEAENLHFRRYLCAHHHRISAFQEVATETQRHIDCTTCANCCRNSIVPVSRPEIEAIAAFLGRTAEDVTARYTAPDSADPRSRVLQSSDGGCVFLKGNLCSIYPARPEPCRDFPHVSLGNPSLGGRFSSLCRWVPLCPIIYNAVERYKNLVGYSPPRADR
jgi:Fe-S-cluster containining protein